MRTRPFLPFSFVLAAVLLSPLPARSQSGFGAWFKDSCLRLDYYHSGTKDAEYMARDRVYLEGAWPGSRANLVDTLNLGEYAVAVTDTASGTLLFSRGFSTMFNEWQTTDEALAGTFKTIAESVRFPFPLRPVRVTISKRDRRQVFHDIMTTVVNPADRTQIVRERRCPGYETVTLRDNGDPHEKVDIVILGDGYTTAELDKFKRDAEHVTAVLFSVSPFKERASDFNVRAVCVTGDESGIDVPDRNVWKRNPLGATYNTFTTPRYVLSEANAALRDAAGCVPYDFMTILINDKRYGGGGIYNLYTTTYTIENNAANAWLRDYVYVHEFGHCFAGLGDEYYSSETGYNDFYPAGVEPWEPNITRMLTPGRVKWQAQVTTGTALPTEWRKREYDSLSLVLSSPPRKDATPEDYKAMAAAHNAIIAEPSLAGVVGAFEGAGYVYEGMYRPSITCIMFLATLSGFDPVCRAAIERQIDFYTK
jgi:hypothetical protein